MGCGASKVPPKGASHTLKGVKWRDDTFAETDADAHVPRYFKEYEDYGDALSKCEGELILRDLLTKEMYDKVTRRESLAPHVCRSYPQSICPHVHAAPTPPPLVLRSTRTRRRRSA